MLFKCTECGNTFTKEAPTQDETVICPICEAQFKATIKTGKIHLEACGLYDNDLGEL